MIYLEMESSLVESLAIGIIGAIIGSFLTDKFARNRSRENDVYIPIFKKVHSISHSLKYDEEVGEFQKVWSAFDGDIQQRIDGNTNIPGELVMLDGRISTLNNFLRDYLNSLDNTSTQSNLIEDSDKECEIAITKNKMKIPTEDFVNQFGETIITATEKSDLWKRLCWKAKGDQIHSEINDWDPSGNILSSYGEPAQKRIGITLRCPNPRMKYIMMQSIRLRKQTKV
ncbi:hypothetical protein [Natrinema sp. SYSU A 869]|uniref:hypothetical protein n=1 Tax=Natrinema sp. SYSU A 869 TaxID=2871694 RepID=UPI001CA45F09|nr:hypothetical protein [Natrinema sp. SYSU A 869]